MTIRERRPDSNGPSKHGKSSEPMVPTSMAGLLARMLSDDVFPAYKVLRAELREVWPSEEDHRRNDKRRA
jgi:hypothetical protein